MKGVVIRMYKRIILRTVFSLITISILLAFCLSSFANTTRLTFSTAGTGGTYYPMGVGVSSFFTKAIPDVEVTCQTSGGSAENIRLLQNEEVDMCWANGSEIFWAWNGEEFFEGKKYNKMRMVSFAWTNTYHFLSLEDSQISEINDFNGKKIGIGPNGSGAAIFGETFLRHIGIWDKIKPMFLPPSDQIVSLKNKNIDVFGYFSGMPMAAIIDISASHNIQIIDLQKDGEKNDFTKTFPFYIKTTIPKGTYKDQKEDIGSYSNLTYWIASEDVPEEIIYNLVKNLFSDEGIEYMKTVHKRSEELALENILKGVKELGVPLHPGVKKFLKENNINI